MNPTLKEANKLFREKKYEEALEIYTKLHQVSPLKIYEDNIKASEEKVSAHNPTKTHVLLITAGLKGPTLGGGIAICFYSLATLLSKSGVQTDILYLADPYYGEKNKEHWELYFKSHNIGFFTPEQPKVYGTKEMRRAYQALQFVTKYHSRYSNIIYHDFQGIGYYVSKLKRATGSVTAKITAWCHGNTRLSMHYGNRSVDDWTGNAVLFMEKESVRLADEIITPSKYYFNWWENQLGQRIAGKSLKNYIDFPTKEKETKTTKLNANIKYICFYGRLETLKGIEVFVSAILKINEKIPQKLKNTCILFAGNDSMVGDKKGSAYVTDALQNKGIDFDFLFNTKAEILFPLINLSNGLFAFPTLGETSSCVVMEAVHYQCPFVASGIDPIKELLHPLSFEKSLATPNDANDLAEKIVQQLDSPEVAKLIDTNEQNASNWITHLKYKKSPKKNKPQSSNYQASDIAVIIPTSDRSELLKECLKSFKNQSIDNFKIIVVDDASEESQKNFEITQNEKVEYIQSKSKIYKGAACNLGASKVEQPIIIFFDDDDLANQNLIESYLNYFNNNDSDIASCFIDVFDHKDSTQSTLYVSLSLGNDLSTSIQCNFFGKGSFAVKNSAFHKMQGYQEDDDAIPMVDYRFYLRAALLGLKIGLIPKSLYKYRKNSPNSIFYSQKNKFNNTARSKNLIANILFKEREKIPADVIAALTHNYFLPKYKLKEVEQTPSVKEPKEFLHWLQKSSENLTIEIKFKSDTTLDLFTSNGEMIASVFFIEKISALTIKAYKSEAIFHLNLKADTSKKINIKVEQHDLIIQIDEDHVILNGAFSIQKHIRKITSNTHFSILDNTK